MEDWGERERERERESDRETDRQTDRQTDRTGQTDISYGVLTEKNTDKNKELYSCQRGNDTALILYISKSNVTKFLTQINASLPLRTLQLCRLSLPVLGMLLNLFRHGR